MQTLNKSLVKNTFAHTWFIYPLSATVLALIWLFAFPAFHQPSAHQKINVFFATDIKSEEFTKSILAKYDKEKLRVITPSYAYPGTNAYYQKFQIAINTADVLVITKSTFEVYKQDYGTFFVPITSYVQEKIGLQEDQIIDGHGILLKKSDETNYLEQYMSFKEEDYYVVLSVTSANMGAAMKEDNAPYDNALTFVHYLLAGV